MDRRAETEPDTVQFRGLAIVFNQRSLDLGGFLEIIRPSAVDRFVSERPDLRALWAHNSQLPIGRLSAGTLRAEKTRQGLAVEVDPPRWAGGQIESVERRDVTGMSFGFIAITDEVHLEDTIVVREILDMQVIEVSPVSFPAYPQTTLRVVRGATRSLWMTERDTAARLRLAR
jgi:HK97 family phage prohead protease